MTTERERVSTSIMTLVTPSGVQEYEREFGEDSPETRAKIREAAREALGLGEADVVISALRISDADPDQVWMLALLSDGTACELQGSDTAIRETMEHAASLVIDIGGNVLAQELLVAARGDDPRFTVTFSGEGE
jgi:hypothetical protein